ncbi:translocation/assembly module TamB [Mariniflexile sp. AS56]|uniref:translocation/assembly module TamB domain-containing protein n=1 Tax=Mariniflexile sp. AS56 TaxID=3063957 RepID=UPI0026EA174B|nr:translocation/assembly module TamB [Mariniflexile sp. AS56]MDO7172313.1 translocation/assembly module TamB domain-containing protein [Mariniflexile sp. AS56]
MKKVAKIILKALLIFVAFFLLIVLALQIPFIQNLVKDKAVTYLESKIKTKVEIGSIEIGLPKKVILNDVYFEDQATDTLLAGKSLKVDINLLQLLSNKVIINSIDLEKITANIKVNNDSVYNFDYIIKAFETNDTKPDSEPMEISIKKINLNNIKFTYKDAVAQNNIGLIINHFDTNISKFDLKKLTFDVPEINLNGLQLILNQDLVEATKKATKKIEEAAETTTLKLNLKDISLENIDVNYKDAITHLNTNFQFKKLDTRVKRIDLEKQVIVLKSIELNNTHGEFTLTKSIKNKEETTEKASSLPWEIGVEQISVSNFNFKFDNNNTLITQTGIDYNHLKLSDLNLKGRSITLGDDAYSAIIDSFTFKENSGFQLDALTTKFNYTSKGASLKGLLLKTPQTTLQDNILVTYPSLESISENLENLILDVHLKESKLGFKDVLLLVPQLSSNAVIKNNPNAIVNFNANVKGKLDNLKIETFNANGIGSTLVDIKGAITGLPNIDRSIFDVTIINFESSSQDVYAFTPKNTIPNTIQLPENFNVKGVFKGSLNTFETNLNLKSTFGNAIVEATFDQSRKNNEKYMADARVESFDLGKLIKNKQIGKVTANATINGKSLDPSTASTTLNSKIVTAIFNGYNYKNISVDGSIDKGLYVTNISSTDPNLDFVLDAQGSSNSEKPTLDLKLNIELVDLNKLNLHAGPLKMKGNVTANFEDLDPDNLNGSVNANNFLVALETEQFPLDTISIRAISNVEKDSIILKSQFANGLISGNYKLSTISDQLVNSISKYYKIDNEYVKDEGNQNFDFDFIIKDNTIIKKIIPEIIELSEITINGSYNSVNDSIVINTFIPRLNYASNEVSNGELKVTTKESALLYDLSFGKIKNEQFEIPRTILNGKLENNTVDYTLNIKDLENKNKYLISGVFKDSVGASIISFNPEKLILNYEDWKIDDTNLIKLDKNNILVSNFKIEKEQQSFSIQSDGDTVTSPIEAKFENFKLESLTSIAISNYEIGGTINGDATVNNIMSNPLFITDLKVENFRIKKDTVGNLVVKVDNETTNLYKASITLKGLDNDLNIDGNYSISSESLDFNVDIQKFQMTSLQPFTLENLKESQGYLNGELNVSGKASNPNVNGNIKFNSVGFVVVPLNSKFKLINDNIVFNTNKIIFDNFKLQDENDNPLKINGSINSSDYTNLGFNLNVIADNFRAVNSTSKDNDLFYGELYLDNNLGIKGTLDSPIIDGTVKINADTKFTIVLPQSDPSIADRDGIVEFIDQDQPVLITVEDPINKMVQTEVKGISASVNIVVDKKAEISIIIDEANGDYLKLQGDAELTGGIDPSGKTTLTGKYEFTGGAYEMNFNLIKRKFEIQPESYILWTGEPTTANINITAVYNVEASPLDLVDDQLVGLTPETRNTYKQRIPFETNLIMKGELLEPKITFDIILPDGNNNVSTEIINTTQAKLEQIRRDEDALNKQVFALLLLNRFIGENPFESQAGGLSGAFLAKQSVSKILSQQLNNLAGDLIKGFELDFDLQATEEYSSGERQERTDLSVGLSKQLLNDRLKVTVGSSFGLEGAPQENEQATNIAGDVTADYLITKDGRYKIRAYRKNNYQVALQGQVIETGVAFIITMNYDKFKELFQKKRNAKLSKEKKNK